MGAPGWTDREFEQIAPDECRLLLRSVPVGRLVFTEDTVPVAHPVNFVMVGDDVIITTGPGQKLDAARRRDVVAFQADEIDTGTRTGWSVLVIGEASVVHDIDRLISLLDPAVRPWPPRGRDRHVIQVAGERIEGRRLVPARRADDATSANRATRKP